MVIHKREMLQSGYRSPERVLFLHALPSSPNETTPKKQVPEESLPIVESIALNRRNDLTGRQDHRENNCDKLDYGFASKLRKVAAHQRYSPHGVGPECCLQGKVLNRFPRRKLACLSDEGENAGSQGGDKLLVKIIRL